MKPQHSAASPLDITALVAQRRPGYSLDAPFYTSQEVFELDLEAIFGRHWLFCATEAAIPEPGDYVTVQVGTRSVIIVRDDDESVRALHNVCRHRGSRMVEDECGSVGNLVCPYHQWTYRTDGTLIHAGGQPASFDRSGFGLGQVHVRTVAGLIFLCFAQEPPADLDEVAAIIEPYLAPYRIASLKVAHQTNIVEAGNWKLVMENNRECQHCDVGHPELVSAYFPFNRYSAESFTPRQQAHFKRFQAAGVQLRQNKARTTVPLDARRELDSRPTGFTIDHLPLDGPGISFGVGGAQVCSKLVGDIPVPEFGDLYLHLQPNVWLHLLSDHVAVFHALPLSPGRTVVRSTWLVNAEAQEGVDYTIEDLTGVWMSTNDQDRGFVEKAHRGVLDPSYKPGPYVPAEDDVEAFVAWYISRLAEYLGQRGTHLSAVPEAAGQ